MLKKGTDRGMRRWRAVALVSVGLAIGVTMMATPAASHVGGTVNHLWGHLKPKADARYVRLAGTMKPGQTERGLYSAWGHGGAYMGDAVTFRMPLAAPISGANVHFIASGDPTTVQCPGAGQAAAGHVCVYERGGGNRTFGQIYQSSNPGGGEGASTKGFGIYFDTTGAAGSWSYGEWAARAPASTASVSGTSASGETPN